MSYLATMTTLLSENKNPQHEAHIYAFEAMARQMIFELGPQMVRQELANTYLDLLVKIQTQINGRNVDFPDIIEYIKNIIEEELQKELK